MLGQFFDNKMRNKDENSGWILDDSRDWMQKYKIHVFVHHGAENDDEKS